MEDNTAPAPTRTVEAIACGKSRASISIVAFTAGIGTMICMTGFAHAEPMISTATAMSDSGILQNVGFAEQRLIFGALTLGFSLLAAGVWHRSFRAAQNSGRPSGH